MGLAGCVVVGGERAATEGDADANGEGMVLWHGCVGNGFEVAEASDCVFGDAARSVGFT